MVPTNTMYTKRSYPQSLELSYGSQEVSKFISYVPKTKWPNSNETENMSNKLFEHVFICRSYYGKRQAIQKYNYLRTSQLFVLFHPLYNLLRTTPMDSLKVTSARWEAQTQIMYEFIILNYEHINLIMYVHLQVNFHNTYKRGKWKHWLLV